VSGKEVEQAYREIVDAYSFNSKFKEWLASSGMVHEIVEYVESEYDISFEVNNIDNTFSKMDYDGYTGKVTFDLDIDDCSASGRYAYEKGICDEEVDQISKDFIDWYNSESERELVTFLSNENVTKVLSYLKNDGAVVEIEIVSGTITRTYYIGSNKPYHAALKRYWAARKGKSASRKYPVLVGKMEEMLGGSKKR